MKLDSKARKYAKGRASQDQGVERQQLYWAYLAGAKAQAELNAKIAKRSSKDWQEFSAKLACDQIHDDILETCEEHTGGKDGK